MVSSWPFFVWQLARRHLHWMLNTVLISLTKLCIDLSSGEMFIPFYTGKVIDILGGQYQPNEFFIALFFMGLFSLGGYVCHVFVQYLQVGCLVCTSSDK